ncbi:carboxypeptidase-like regulatory domain-containing protein [bacterium]|nr:carboxypeptidase-like regulatory domain-containing protein [bacterium]
MRRITLAIVLFLILIPFMLFSEPWRVDLVVNTEGFDFDLTIGTSPGCSWHYDAGIDVSFPIPPPVNPYAFFPLDDPDMPHITMLTGDIRAEGEETYTWEVHLERGDRPQTLYWNPQLLPRGSFMASAHYPGVDPTDWVNMRGSRSLGFMPAQVVTIEYTPDGEAGTSAPYAENWDPVPLSTGNVPNATVSVTLIDDETGVNTSSLEFYVLGEDVTDEVTFTIASGEMSIEYLPDEGYPLGMWVDVRVVAADLAFPPNILDETMTFRTTEDPFYMPEWEVALNVWSSNEGDTSFFDLSFGGDPRATAGFNFGYDLALPPAPPSEPYAYFPLSDSIFPYYTMLSRDIHNSNMGIDYWKIMVGNSRMYNGISWNAGDLPVNYTFQIGAAYPATMPDEWFNMSEITSLTDVMIGKIIWIKATKEVVDTIPPVIYDWSPEDGAVSVSVSTNISVYISDYESGVDEGTVTMSVNGDDVTSSLVIEVYEDYVWVFYDPPYDFPQMTTIEVTVGVYDLATPANLGTATIHFTTGYFLAPEWFDTLFIHTQESPDDDTMTFQLVFGADEVGTDGFDAGLDMISPPMPPGDNPFAYFQIDDPTFPMLLRDIRYSRAESLYWTAMLLNYSYDPSTTNWLSWHSELLPPVGNFYIGYTDFANPPEEWHDMRRISRFNFTGAGRAIIHFWLTGPERWCLSGIVTLSDSPHDLSGTIVSCPELEISATTDSTGHFELCEIPSGTYQFQVSHDGYNTVNQSIAILSDVYHDFNLTLTTYNVYGIATLEGVPEEEHDGTMVTLNGDTAYTNEDGNYFFSNVVPGEYTLTFSHFGYTIIETVITVVNSNVVVNVELSMQKGRIYGVVTLEGEDPLNGTLVILDGTDSAYTNNFGEFMFPNLPMYQTYDLSLQRENYQTVDTSIYLDDIEVVVNIFMLFKRYDICGVVQSSDEEPLAGSIVHISITAMDSIITGEDGSFCFMDLLPGEYTITVYHFDYGGFDTTLFLNRDVMLDITLFSSAPPLNPPRNLSVVNGLNQRVPMSWDPPEATAATLIGYIIYQGIGSWIDSIGYVSGWATSYIDFGLSNWIPRTYWVAALYEEGLSDYSNWALGTPTPNEGHSDVLVYDFDNGATLCSGSTEGVEAAHSRMLETFNVIHDVTEQDAPLDDYNLLEYIAVFVGTGVYDLNQTEIRDEDLWKLAEYLEAGGRIYWEGADFGFDYYYHGEDSPISRQLYGMFGIEFHGDGDPDSNVSRLRGGVGFFGAPVNVDYPIGTPADRFIDVIEPAGSEIIMVSHRGRPDSTTNRIAAYQTPRWRTVYSAIYLGAIIDREHPHTQYYIMGKIFEFLTGIEVVYPGISELKLPEKPDRYTLSNNYPNPFNLNTYISFGLVENADVELVINDVLGNEVNTLLSQALPSGYYVVDWNGRDQYNNEVPSGIYFYTLRAGEVTLTKRMMVVK